MLQIDDSDKLSRLIISSLCVVLRLHTCYFSAIGLSVQSCTFISRTQDCDLLTFHCVARLDTFYHAFLSIQYRSGNILHSHLRLREE